MTATLTAQNAPDRHKLVVTGQDPCPVELFKGIGIQRQDLINHHEEADVIVTSQAMYVASVEHKSVGVVADDTDIYILLLYHYKIQQLASPMIMIPTKQGRTATDIGLTSEKLGNLCFQLLPAHALTGCDQVPMHYGIGKGKMLKVAKEAENSLSLLGNMAANMEDVIEQATSFMATCYSVQAANMTEARVKVWQTRTMKKTAKKALPLCSLPPTSACFRENVKRAHLQAAIWRNAEGDPPNVDPTHFGWERQDELKLIRPITIPSSEKIAPENVLKVLCCTCSSNALCRTRQCGCHAAPLGCTVYCSCQGWYNCNNPHTVMTLEENSDDDS